jgi:FAD/FMN-containing dehydrogenase
MADGMAAHDSLEADGQGESFLAGLAGIVGQDAVLTGLDKRVFFSTDIAAEGQTAECVIRPRDRDTLSRAVAFATAQGRAVIPRGGGFSYTGGYRPVREGSVMVDMRGFDRVLEINREDMYVTVECGCTWKTLYDALKAEGLRTPYFGPMSGYSASVGGALSQGSFFLGSTQYGTVAESVLSVEVVLADGSVVQTGSAAGTHRPAPFYRYYGPDLTGLFLSDAGAFGLKLSATLRLIPFPAHQAFASFALSAVPDVIALLSEISRSGLAAECYAWDPVFVKSVGESTGLGQDIRYLVGVVGSGKSKLAGLRDAARMAIAGKSLFDGSTHLVHVSIDDATAGGAAERLAAIRAIAAAKGAGEVPATAPRTTRGTPFTDFRHSLKAQAGVRSLPVHGMVPHSRAQELAAAVGAFFAGHAALMRAHDITHGVVVFAVGTTMVCIEPLIFVTDTRYKLHDRLAEKSDVAALAAFGPPPEASVHALQLRKDLVDVFTACGAAHVQIGKTYPWRETRTPAALHLLEAIKASVDPRGLMNPGALGFSA